MIILSLIGMGITSTQAQQGRPPSPVEVSAAEEDDVQSFRVLPGTVISRNDAIMSIEVDGLLVHLADIGDRVSSGDVLAEIDTRTMELNRRTAAARIKEIEPRLDFYTEEADRLTALAEADNVSRSASEEAVAARDELAGQLRTAKLQLEIAEDTLRKSRVLAPHDGIVSGRLSEPGEFVKQGNDILRLVDLSVTEVQARVPDDVARHLQIGQSVPLTTDDGSVEKAGRLRVLVPVADTSRLYEARITFGGENWPVGLATRVFFSKGDARPGILVPRDSLVIRSYGTYVLRVTDESKVEQIPVRIGEAVRDNKKIEVLGNLQAGDRLVVRGGERLLPGQSVVITSGDAALMGEEGVATTPKGSPP